MENITESEADNGIEILMSTSDMQTETSKPGGNSIHLDIDDEDLRLFLYYVTQEPDTLYKEYIAALSSSSSVSSYTSKKRQKNIFEYLFEEESSKKTAAFEVIEILNDFSHIKSHYEQITNEENENENEDSNESSETDSWFDIADARIGNPGDFEYFNPAENYYTSCFNKYLISLIPAIDFFADEKTLEKTKRLSIKEEATKLQDDVEIHPNLSKKLEIRDRFLEHCVSLLKVANYLQCYRLLHSTALTFCAMMPSPDLLSELPIAVFEEVMLHLPTVILARCPPTLMTDRRWFHLICKKFYFTNEDLNICLESDFCSVAVESEPLLLFTDENEINNYVDDIGDHEKSMTALSNSSKSETKSAKKIMMPVVLISSSKIKPEEGNLITTLTPTSFHTKSNFMLNTTLLSSPDSYMASPNLNLSRQKNLYINSNVGKVGERLKQMQKSNINNVGRTQKVSMSPKEYIGVGNLSSKFNTPIESSTTPPNLRTASSDGNNSVAASQNSPSNAAWMIEHGMAEKYVGQVHDSNIDVMSTLEEFNSKKNVNKNPYSPSFNLSSSEAFALGNRAHEEAEYNVFNDNDHNNVVTDSHYRRHPKDAYLIFWRTVFLQLELQNIIRNFNKRSALPSVQYINSDNLDSSGNIAMITTTYKNKETKGDTIENMSQFLDLASSIGRYITSLVIRNDNPEIVALIASHILLSSTTKSQFPHLIAVDLSKNRLTCDEVECISNSLKGNRTLKKLILSSNRFCATGMNSLVRALLNVKYITSSSGTTQIKISRNDISRIEYLYLDSNGIGPSGAKLISYFIRYSPSLKKISLSYNQCKGEGVIDICNAIKKNKYSKLTSLDLSHSYGGTATAKAIASLITEQDSWVKVRAIKCWDSTMSIVEGRILISALEKSVHVTDLGISATCFTSQDRQYFASYLKRNREICNGNAFLFKKFVDSHDADLNTLIKSDYILFALFSKTDFSDEKTLENCVDNSSTTKKKAINQVTEDKYAKRRIEEVDLLYGSDTIYASEWYIISESWLKLWRAFANANSLAPPPPPIDNWCLIDRASMRPKPGLKKTEDYRGIAPTVWFLFYKIYGGGPCIIRKNVDIYSPAIKQRDENGNMSL